jgi:phosphatidylinositol-3,4,5-trisphosphate 3-phosphatase/dual-specificity protein phosphatase PTEN
MRANKGLKNTIRSKVSGDRNRAIESGYDLDLSYITNAVFGMSFPASKKIEKLYRNDIVSVAGYLDKYYPNGYFVYNMSNKEVVKEKFHGRLNSYEWEDHHSPSLSVLFSSCNHMFLHVLKDPKNVIVIHCNAGKGRAGTSISCFLLYSGLA